MYPGLWRRIVATAIDIVAVSGMIYLVTQYLFVDAGGSMLVLSGVGVAMLYEPLLTVFACTLGQGLMRIRVRHFETLRRISVRKSYLRFLTKYIGSILAGAVNTPSEDLRANHDDVAGTVVITADAAQEASVVPGR